MRRVCILKREENERDVERNEGNSVEISFECMECMECRGVYLFLV